MAYLTLFNQPAKMVVPTSFTKYRTSRTAKSWPHRYRHWLFDKGHLAWLNACVQRAAELNARILKYPNTKFKPKPKDRLTQYILGQGGYAFLSYAEYIALGGSPCKEWLGRTACFGLGSTLGGKACTWPILGFVYASREVQKPLIP